MLLSALVSGRGFVSHSEGGECGPMKSLETEVSGSKAESIKRVYQLRDPAIRFQASQLDSSDYAGKVIYRKSCQVGPDAGASAERRPASAPVGLSKSLF